ncbi:hypothetical protein PO909_023393 [Leuciscus waleckii]
MTMASVPNFSHAFRHALTLTPRVNVPTALARGSPGSTSSHRACHSTSARRPVGSFLHRLFLTAPLWLDVALPVPQTSGSSAVLHSSTPLTVMGSAFPSAPPWSSVPPALPQFSGTLAPPWMHVAMAPPTLLSSLASPTAFALAFCFLLFASSSFAYEASSLPPSSVGLVMA